MNRLLRKAMQRSQYAVAETDAPAIKGPPITQAEDKRMSEWLKRKGEPNLSMWKRRVK